MQGFRPSADRRWTDPRVPACAGSDKYQSLLLTGPRNFRMVEASYITPLLQVYFAARAWVELLDGIGEHVLLATDGTA
jgi:hypothetical protein